MRLLVPFAALFSVAQALSAPGPSGPTSQDRCGHVAAPLILSRGLGSPPVVIGYIDSCLCISQIPNFLITNALARAGVDLFGVGLTKNALTAMVLNVAKQCNYPDNSLPQCLVDDPCSFGCTNGFASAGVSCTCMAPKQVCNGICTDTVNCPSTIVQDPRQLRSTWQKRTSCDVGFTACGTTSSYRKSIGAYECVDTRTNLESCGGCDIPLHENSPRGQDCTSIPGVADVSCYNGACRVYDCMPGYAISFDQGTCHSEDQLRIIKDLIENPHKMAIDLM